MDRLVAIAVFMVALSAAATDYYVTTNGNNAADGSISTPWSNIWYSATQAAAGDTVHIGPGTFREFITNTASGSDGSPITFQGTRSGTNWLTIIDPSTDLSTGWVAAPEAGSNVYKITGLAFTPRELSITNQRVAFVYTTNSLGANNPYAESATWLTNGIQFLQLATDQVLTIETDSVTWWDTVGALYTATNNAVYLRLRDGSDPEGMDIRGAPNRDTDWNPSPAVQGGVSAIWISEKSHIVWRDVSIRNAYAGIVVIGTTAHDITIVSNYIQGGHSRIVLQETPYNCYIYSNTLTTAYYGTTNIGAWNDGTSTLYKDRRNNYEVAKYLMGQSTSFDEAIRLFYAGSSNKFIGNYIYSGLGSGWQAYAGVTAPTDGTEIAHNRFDNFPSTGMTVSSGSGWMQIHDNRFDDINIPIRWGTLNTTGETNRICYIYRNQFWLPDGIGSHLFFHWYETPVITNRSDMWIYHNSFSGGAHAVQFNTYANENGGVPGLKLLNNIMTGYTVSGIDLDSDFKAASFVGTLDWDYHYPAYPAGILWMGTNNIIGTSNQWVNAVGMSFALPADSQAIDAALDVSTTFSAAGQSWPALPDTATKVGTAWDIGALEYSAPPIVITNRVQYTEDLWIK